MNVIYRITCTINGKSYIGKDTRYPKRMSDHKSRLRGNYHVNKYLQRAWNKHGETNFKFEIVQSDIDLSLLSLLEIYWIEYHETYLKSKGYNITLGLGSYGMTKSESTKRKISASLKGKKLSKERIANAARSRWKTLYQYTKGGDLIKTYSSVKQCCEENGYKSCTITGCCQGKTRTAYGYRFSYKLMEQTK